MKSVFLFQFVFVIVQYYIFIGKLFFWGFFLIHVDVQGHNDSIPLSPQWLLPKPGESKAGIVTGVRSLLLSFSLFKSCNIPTFEKHLSVELEAVKVFRLNSVAVLIKLLIDKLV